MNVFKRWTSGVVTSFDWVANQVENHEALVAAAISEMQTAAAKAQVQMKRVQKDGETLRTQLIDSRENVEKWSQRATQSSDEQKALECVRRKRRSEQEVIYLKERLDGHTQLERQLKKDLDTVQIRLAELRRKKNTFLAKKYNSDATKAGSLEQVGLMHEIDDIFERWEIRMAQCEPISEQIDSFDREFEEVEELQELKAELEILKEGVKK